MYISIIIMDAASAICDLHMECPILVLHLIISFCLSHQYDADGAHVVVVEEEYEEKNKVERKIVNNQEISPISVGIT